MNLLGLDFHILKVLLQFESQQLAGFWRALLSNYVFSGWVSGVAVATVHHSVGYKGVATAGSLHKVNYQARVTKFSTTHL
jgi:hypothetical protein